MNNEEWNIGCDKVSDYLDVCLDASLYEDKFNVFKSNQIYRQILEHVGAPISMEMVTNMGLDIIGDDELNNYLLSKIDRIRDNNKYGSPEIFNYPTLGNLSPSTVRYIKNCWDILNHFGLENLSNKDLKIVEIGGGYGGMCTVVDALLGFSKYYIFDLKEVNMLQSKYLSKSILSGEALTIVSEECPVFNAGDIDLLISTHALSEVPYNLQIRYIENVVSKCKSFYIEWNTISETSEYNSGMTYNEFIKTMSQFDIIVFPSIRNCPEDPIDSSPGKVLYGRLKNKL